MWRGVVGEGGDGESEWDETGFGGGARRRVECERDFETNRLKKELNLGFSDFSFYI